MDGAVKLERVHVGLKEGRPLLQTVDRQMVSGAQGVLVAALVDPTMGPPGAPDSYPTFHKPILCKSLARRFVL